MRSAVLVTAPVSAEVQEKAARGLIPRPDYYLLAKELDARLITPFVHESKRSGLLPKVRMIAKSAWAAFRRRDNYDVLVTDIDRVGVLLALMFKLSRARKGHVVICHGKMVHPFDRRLVRLLRLYSHVDRFVCYGPEIADQVRAAFPIDQKKVVTLRHAADHRFWRPTEVEQRAKVVSAGLFQRDYPTLIEAVRGLDITLEIAGHSPWVPEKTRRLSEGILPDNVRLSSHDYASLRDLYSSALCIAVPLVEHDTQAGSLVVYEAMAMGKPVVVTRTRGQAAMGLVRDGETGFYVAPGDVDGWRKALTYLHEHPDEAMRMGQNARRVVEAGMNLESFVADLAGVVREVGRELGFRPGDGSR